jgi:hypothetical protein
VIILVGKSQQQCKRLTDKGAGSVDSQENFLEAEAEQ